MRSPLVLLLILSTKAFASVMLVESKEPQVLTIYEVMRKVLTNSLELKRSEQGVLVDQGEAKIGLSALLPKASLNLGRSYSYFDQGLEDSLSLNLMVPFFFGKKLFEARAKHEQMLVAKEKNRFLAESLMSKVGKLYIEALLLEAGKDIAKEQWQQAEQQLLTLEKKLKVGRARNLDILRSQYLSSKAHSEFLLKEQSLEQKIGEIGVEISMPERFLLSMVKIESPYLDKDKKELLVLADQNIEAKALRMEVKALDKSLVAERLDFLPRLFMSADLGLDNRPSVPSSRSNLKFLLNLELPLFSGGSTMAAIKTKLASRTIAEITERQKSQERVLTINSLLEEMRRLKQIKESTEKALKAATEARNSGERMFKEGEATSIELVEANTNLFDAKSQSVTLELDNEQLKLKLLFTIGKLREIL